MHWLGWLLVVLGVLAALPVPVFAQNETNATTQTYINISIANISIHYPYTLQVTAEYKDNTTLRIIVTEGGINAFPVNITVVCGNTSQAINLSVSDFTSYGVLYRNITEIHVNATSCLVKWVSPYGSGSLEVSYSLLPLDKLSAYIISMLPVAIMAGFLMRGSVLHSALGGVLASLVIYIGGRVGLWPITNYIVTLSLITGALLLWFNRRG